jgi:nitroimidazol reductase NimA-like FMN-containing flavoprotein (pyridoxamine 5'-phosphate oxidase superfamily)
MKNRSLASQQEIDEIIKKCQVCHIAMADANGIPYVIPMNFGYRDGVIYLHSSRHGKKIDILKSNPKICIAFSTDYHLRYQHEDVACSYSMKYRSVLAHGSVEFVEDTEEKIRHLDIVMAQYSTREFKFNPPALREVCCYKVVVEKFEGRVYGY